MNNHPAEVPVEKLEMHACFGGGTAGNKKQVGGAINSRAVTASHALLEN